MIKKLLLTVSLFIGSILAFGSVATAHVIVTPDTAKVAQELVFSISSPNERLTPIVKLKLSIPEGVEDVLPTQNTGWNVTTIKAGNDKHVTTIVWNGGQIPVGQRADFSFSAQVPGSATTLKWKAYQTYKDGTVVNWDQAPDAGSKDDDGATSGPYSTTKIVNDLTGDSTTSADTSSTSNTVSLILSAAALGIAIAAFIKVRSR